MKEVYLTEPSGQEIDEAFRKLEKGGQVFIRIKTSGLGESLAYCEKTGFAAIEIIDYRPDASNITIKGYKGKHGPCFDTGRKVKYTGSARAALDDDDHLLLLDQYSPVCEKTALMFQFPPYRDLVTVTKGEADLIEKYKYNPEKFDKDAFEDDQAGLFDGFRNQKKEEARAFAFYPGPFKVLVLTDGTIVRRGTINNVPKEGLDKLIRSDHLIRVQADTSAAAKFFQDEYRRKGSICLLQEQPIRGRIESEPASQTGWEALLNLNRKLSDRLKDLIHLRRTYFILTGSDPFDKLGCCPSDEVGVANKLVKAGILDSVSQDTHGDACPVTIYAFKKEIKKHNEDIEFHINQDFRDLVLKHLERKRYGGMLRIVKWMLVGFFILSLALAIIRTRDSIFSGAGEGPRNLYEYFAPLQENTTMVLLFHNQLRCTMCLNMERNINTLIERKYAAYLDNGRIQIKLVNMNSEENLPLVKQFDLYTASVVLLRFESGKEKEVIVMRDIWEFHADQDKFMQEVNRELEKLIQD